MTMEKAKQQFLERLSEEHEAFRVTCSDHALFMKKAFDHFLEVGFCDYKPSDERYLPLQKLYESSSMLKAPSALTRQSLLDRVLPECLHSYLVLKDGQIQLDLSDLSDLPKGCVIESLESQTSAYRSFVYAQAIAAQKAETDPLSLLCQAHLKGALILIPEGLKLDKPLQIIDLSHKSQQLCVSNLSIHVGEDAQCDIVLSLETDIEACLYTQLFLEHRAQVCFTRLQSAEIGMRFDKMVVHLNKQAQVKLVDLCEPSKFSRFLCHVNHYHKGASSCFYALALIGGQNNYHIGTCFEHQGPETNSLQLVKTVLRSKSRALFSGKIHIHQDAVLTQSYQKHDTLMLGEHGQICSRPNLKILADDVKASHGATIAALDQEALFYLKTRGLSETIAKTLLLDAFCHKVLEHTPLPSIKSQVLQRLSKDFIDECSRSL